METNLCFISIAYLLLVCTQIVTASNSTLKIFSGGSSLTAEAHQRFSLAYSRSNTNNAKITYESVGSSTGILKVVSGDYAFAGSDYPLTHEYLAQDSDLKHFPVMAGGMALIYNLPGVTSLVLSREAVVGIFNGTISHWNHTAIVQTNPDEIMPYEPITRVVRKDQSGMTHTFTTALSSFHPSWNQTVGVSVLPIWPSEGSNLVKANQNLGVAQNVFFRYFSIGYSSLQIASKYEIPAAKIINKQGIAMFPSVETIQAAVNNKVSDIEQYLSADTIDGEAGYPMSSLTYVVYHGNTNSCAVAKALLEYFMFITQESSGEDILDLGFVPLPSSVRINVQNSFNTFKCAGQLVWDLLRPQAQNEHTVIIALGVSIAAVIVVGVLVISVLACILVTRKRRNKVYSFAEGPRGFMAIIFTDIKSSTMLWDTEHFGMEQALQAHDKIFRERLTALGGYEVKTEGDAFMVAFKDPVKAIRWCLDCQDRLVNAEYAESFLKIKDCEPIIDGDNQAIWRGLRVRMGVHVGEPVCKQDKTTMRTDYFGPVVNCCARVSDVADGGQILITKETLDYIKPHLFDLDMPSVKRAGSFSLKGIEAKQELFTILPSHLAKRIFENTREYSGRRLSLAVSDEKNSTGSNGKYKVQPV